MFLTTIYDPQHSLEIDQVEDMEKEEVINEISKSLFE